MYHSKKLLFGVFVCLIFLGVNQVHAQAVSGVPSPGNPYGLSFPQGDGSILNNNTDNTGTDNSNETSDGNNGQEGDVIAQGLVGPDGEIITNATIDGEGVIRDMDGNIIATNATDANGNLIRNARILADGRVVRVGTGSFIIDQPDTTAEKAGIISPGLYGPNGVLLRNVIIDADGNVIDDAGNIVASGLLDPDGNLITNATILPNGVVLADPPSHFTHPTGTVIAQNVLDAAGKKIKKAFIDSKGRIIKDGKIVGQNLLDSSGRIIRNATIDKKGRVIASGTPIYHFAARVLNTVKEVTGNPWWLIALLWMLVLAFVAVLLWFFRWLYYYFTGEREIRDVILRSYDAPETDDHEALHLPEEPVYSRDGVAPIPQQQPFTEPIQTPRTPVEKIDPEVALNKAKTENTDYVTFKVNKKN